MKGKPSSHQKTDGAHKTCRGRSGKGFNRSSSTESNAKVNVREKKSNLIGRGLKAPVKKIPNVHSSSVSSSAQLGHVADPTTMRQLLQERQRNKILQLEVERLRKSLEICKKSINEKTNELEGKNKLINKLMEDRTRIEATNDTMEGDIDIDNLLTANFGGEEVDLNDLLNLSNSAFPDDLGNLDINSVMQEQSLCLSPSSLRLATNTSYVVDEGSTQLPNREEGIDIEENGDVKSLVGRMVEQKKNFNLSKHEESQIKKVSPLKIIRGGNQFKLVGSKRPSDESCEGTLAQKKPKSSGKVLPNAPQCLACPQCTKKFPLGGQWALERHVLAAHSDANRSQNCCQYCDKQFSYESCFAAHVRWHELTNPWKCGKCDYKIDGLDKFVKHVRSVHDVKSVESAKKLMVSLRC